MWQRVCWAGGHLWVFGLAFPINLQSLLWIKLVPPPNSPAICNRLVVSSKLHSLQDTEPKDVDFTVTCDGIWSRRGFTATYGAGVVMSWDSGQVLDAVVLSKRCNVCKLKESTLDEHEFLDWYVAHEEFCNWNYSGSSPAMEAESTSRLFARSVERHGSDTPGWFLMGMPSQWRGSTASNLMGVMSRWGNLQNYICGDFIFVFVLLNCVFNNFRSWSAWAMSRSDSERGWETIKDDTGHVLNLRWGGRDRLTDKTIDMPQLFYGRAVCSNSHNVDCMYNAIWAVFFHNSIFLLYFAGFNYFYHIFLSSYIYIQA